MPDTIEALRARVEVMQALAAKATPGPWTFSLADCYEIGIRRLVLGPPSGAQGNSGDALADVWSENDADGPLMAAAPDLVTYLTDLLAALEAAQTERDEARKMLAECYVLSGADPDDDDWRHLWQTAVAEVRQTMEERRADDEECDRLRLRVAELEEKHCNHNVTAILTVDGNNRLRGPA